jgi:osmotically-inducible protein OsmY
MADRYEGRYRAEPYRGERGSGREDRGFTERAGDEVRSWFGDEEAERRRRMDERDRERERASGRDYGPGAYGRGSERGWSERGYSYPGERGWSGERWGAGERSTGDYGRIEYDQTGGGYGMTGFRGETGYGTRFGGGYTGMPGTAGESYTRRGGRYGLGWETGRGEFVGRGPKGYQRSDARINEDVCDRLADAPYIDASNIEVKVNNGEVTLSGTVSDREDKRRSEDLIENVSGVREVHNNLRVARWQEGTTAVGAGTATGAAAGTTRR